MNGLAVVPIFVNGGIAVLPALLAGAASVGALLLKPRELVRACRRRPGAAAGVVGGLVLVTCGVFWLASGGEAQGAAKLVGPRGTVNAPRRDWAKVAMDVIRQEGAAHLAGAPATPPAPATTSPAAGGTPIVLGYDYSRCSYAGGPEPVGLALLWEFKPDETMFLAAPLVAGHRVYVAGCQLDVGGYTGLLACLDAATGKAVWQIDRAGDEALKPLFSSPALSADGQSLLIGQGLHEDHDCSLLCLDAATGQLRWRARTPLHIESSPAILGDLVVVGAGAIEGSDHKPTGDPGHVIAVRISDGKELWRQPVNDPESSPAIGEDGMVYVGSGFNGSEVVALRSRPDDELRAANLDRVAWRAKVPHPVTGVVTLAGDLVIVGAGNSDYVYSDPRPAGVVVALDRKTGAPRWQVEFGDAVLGAVAHRDGRLICPVRTGEVVALDVATGHERWRQPISGRSPVLAGPAVTGRYVYAASADGYLATLDVTNGRPVGRKVYLNDEARPGKDGRTYASPVVAGGRVYAGSETGGVRCYVGGAGGSR